MCEIETPQSVPPEVARALPPMRAHFRREEWFKFGAIFVSFLAVAVTVNIIIFNGMLDSREKAAERRWHEFQIIVIEKMTKTEVAFAEHDGNLDEHWDLERKQKQSDRAERNSENYTDAQMKIHKAEGH